MENLVTFPNFITKDMEVKKSETREFTGHMTAEIVDKQYEFVYVDEIMKVMETFMEHSPHITDSHSNRIVGEIMGYEKSEIDGHPSILVKGKIKKAENVMLYDDVWNKIKTGIYKGLSMGGGTKRKENMLLKDGKMVQLLKDLELYEIAVCETPANPLALIKEVNTFAKANGLQPEMIKTVDFDKTMIQCTSISCGFEKEYETMQKPVRGHSFEYWQEKLHRENPDYTDEQVNATIGSWEHETKKQDNINVDDTNNNLYKPTSDNFNKDMDEHDEKDKKEEKVEKTYSKDEVDQLVKDALIQKSKDDRIDGLEKSISELKETIKTMNENPVDKGQEDNLSPKGTAAEEDVGDESVDITTAPQIPTPNDALPSIVPEGNEKPGVDASSLVQEQKAEDKKDEDDDKKKDKKEEYMEKSDNVYPVIKAVRPEVVRKDHSDRPTAYQMLKAAENGWGGKATTAREAGTILMSKLKDGEFGNGSTRGFV